MNKMIKLNRAMGIRLGALGVFAATVAFAASAVAGLTIKNEVWISGSWAGGSISAARGSSDGTQYVGCYAYAGDYGNCTVVTRNGTSKWCYTYNEGHRQAIHGINQASRIDFSVNPDNTCGMISVGGDSRYLP
jgi:hypothetical protein